MNRIIGFFRSALACVSLATVTGTAWAGCGELSGDFRIRDPFVVTDHAAGKYYLYSSTSSAYGKDPPVSPQFPVGVQVRTSTDLKNWSEPRLCMEAPKWAGFVWAPEVHAYQGAYYMFATLKRPDPRDPPVEMMGPTKEWNDAHRYRFSWHGTYVFKSARPEGPFVLHADEPLTPKNWMGLDGTLAVQDGKPYFVFTHDWAQIADGTVELAPFKPDLSGLAGPPKTLFRASAVSPGTLRGVTDGPFVYRSPKSGKLFITWSTHNPKKKLGSAYCVVASESESGRLEGPWKKHRIIFDENGGHGMIFKTLEGELMFALHRPEVVGEERARFYRFTDDGEKLSIVGAPAKKWFVANEDNDRFFLAAKKDSDLTEEGVRRYFEESVGAPGSKVTHYFMCVNGQRPSYDSKVWEPIWEGVNDRNEHGKTNDRWCVNAKILHDRGIDPWKIWIEMSRKRGISPWISMRMNDCHYGYFDYKVHRNETFWWTHPELWIDPGGKGRKPVRYFDYAKKGVRDHAMALVKEILERWDADGIELDWVRELRCLGADRARRDAHYLTSFMRDVAKEVAAAAKRRGHPVRIAIRLPSTLENAAEFGYDVHALAKEGIVDVVIPTSGYSTPDYNMDLAAWRRALSVGPKKILLIPGSDCCLHTSRERRLHLTEDLSFLHGWAHMNADGDGHYLFNVQYYKPQFMRQSVYTSGFDRGWLATVDRRFPVTYHETSPNRVGKDLQLPRSIREKPVKFRVYAARGARDIRAELIVAVDSPKCAPPCLRLNGMKAKSPPRPVVVDSIVRKPVLMKSAWAWEFPPEAVKTGENVVEVEPGRNADAVWCELQMKTGAGDALEKMMPVPRSVRGFGGTMQSRGWGSVKQVRGWVEGAPRDTGMEAYCLEITDNGVFARASSNAGMRYARTTFEQLEKLSGGKLPCCRITDYPAFKWRGFMHDSGRNFLEVEHVKRLIDVMARAKMNLFHWHFTEYYAWRLESKKYPELQKDETFYLRYIGKYYTQEQFKEVVNYAYERGITVMPEFDVPGHALAFRRAFGFKTMRDEGVREKLCDLIDELCSLVPKERMPFVHLGSDEARYPEELVPDGWMKPLLERVFANGRKVVGWTPGELAGLEHTGPVIGMRWGNVDSTGGTGRIPYFDAAQMYIDTMDPFEIPCVATYRRICPWDAEKEGERLGAVMCAWHDDFAGQGVLTIRNQCMIPALVLFGDAYWHGRDHMPKGINARISPRADDAMLAYLAAAERRMTAQRDVIYRDVPYPFQFVSQSSMRWRITDGETGERVADDVAQGTVFFWQRPLDGVEAKVIDGGEPNLFSKTSGVAVAETWIKSPKKQKVGAWIGFTDYTRDHGRAWSTPTPGIGQWNRFNATVEVNGVKVPPPEWKNPACGQGPEVPFIRVRQLDEVPFTDEEYYMREPTTVELKEGWNHVKLTVPMRTRARGHNPWVATFVPLAGTTDRPREVPDLEYSCNPPDLEAGPKIDFSVRTGKIKPMHAVNNSPLRLGTEQKEFRLAGIPYMRTHDTVGAWGGTRYIDIPNIFPDFDADENDPASYDFAFTDAYLKPIVESGCKVFYRLGVTIENNYRIKSYHVKPPKDFAKWARICERVVAHYNEGWNNGFRWGIEYWEIWNECDTGGAMWQGTREEFFELYRVTARLLKEKHPAIKVGGYGGGGFYSVDDPLNKVRSFGPNPAKTARFVEWFREFCRYVTTPETAAPLDFFSWHYYWNNEIMDYSRIQTHAAFVRKTLDSFGLGKCESIMNEWNTRVNGYHGMKGMFGASFVAHMFCLMQDSPIDMAMYYDACPSRTYCGMFEPIGCATTPCFESFVAWNELYRLGGAVRTSAVAEKVGVAAATDGRAKSFLLVNAFERPRRLLPEVAGADGEEFVLYLLGAKNAKLRAVGTWRAGGEIEIPPLGVVVAATDFAGPRQLLIAGDSLLEERSGATSYGSWGQQLGPFLAGDVVIDNHAVSGRSTKSFIDDGRWEKLLGCIRKGDWVLVSFGANDVKNDARRYTDIDTFRKNYERFADDVSARGGRAVFVSPVCAWDFDADGRFREAAHVPERTKAIADAAKAKGALFIDMAGLTAAELAEKGKNDTELYYMIKRTGKYDTVHTTRWGAKRYAEIFVDHVRTTGSSLAEIFKPGKGLPVPKLKVDAVN